MLIPTALPLTAIARLRGCRSVVYHGTTL